MIAATLGQIGAAVGGVVVGDETLVVDGPAVVDSRRSEPGALFVAVVGEHADGHDFVASALAAGAVASLATRSVPGPHVLVDDPVAALGRLAAERLAVRRAAGPLDVIAVTGSQGKTSVKDLIGHVLAAAGPTVAPEGSFNNELGVPLTVLRVDADTRRLVLEMGARGVGHLAHLCQIAPPDVAVVLNVGSAHTGEFGGLDRTAAAKGELVESLGPDGAAVLNADDPRVAAMAARTAGRVLTFGREGEIRLVGDVRLDERGHPHFSVSTPEGEFTVTVPQLGRHHAINAVAAIAAVAAVGVSIAEAVVALASAEATSPMRMQPLRSASGALIVNDAYNANPESTAAALQSVAELAPGRAIAVLGEMLELGDAAEQEHRRIGRLAAELGVARVVAVGPGAAPIAAGAGTVGQVADDVEAAIELVSAWLNAEAVVLVKASRGARLERVVDALLTV